MSTPSRPARRPLALLLGAGVLVALVRISWRTHLFATPGRAAVTDLVGCAAAALALWGVLAMRALAAGRALADELEEGLAAAALAAWLVALVPPRAENYRAEGALDDFALAYAPASLAAVLAVLALRRWWPGRDARDVVLRHLAALALVLPLLGGLVRHLVGGPGAHHLLLRCLLLAGVAAAALAGARWRWPAQGP